MRNNGSVLGPTNILNSLRANGIFGLVDVQPNRSSNIWPAFVIITWSTNSGSLGTQFENTSFSSTVLANANNGGLSYSIASGTLPGGLSLNNSSGAITGTLNTVASNTTFNFTIRATSSIAPDVISDRAFSITVNATTVSWNTAAGSLGSDYTERNSSFSVSASTNSGSISSYSIVSGSVPTGQSLNSGSGVISGTASGVSDFSATTFNFTVRATNNSGKTADRAFSITITSRYVGFHCFTTNEGGGLGGTAPDPFIYNRRDFSSYGTPEGGCGGFTIGWCNSGSSNSYNPTPTKSFSTAATNGIWGDPCGGTPKRMYIQLSFGPF